MDGIGIKRIKFGNGFGQGSSVGYNGFSFGVSLVFQVIKNFLGQGPDRAFRVLGHDPLHTFHQ